MRANASSCQLRTFLNRSMFSGYCWHISVTSVTPAISTPWFRSFNRDLVFGKKFSQSSGTLRMIRSAQSAAFFLIYVLELPSSFSTSEHRSRAISEEEMFPKVHSARPTTYILLWLRSLFYNHGKLAHK